MSVLPVGASLAQIVPDYEEMLRDPARYFAAEPLVLGPRRAYQFATCFALGGVGCLIAAGVAGVWNDERLLLGVGLLVGAAVWLGWSLRFHGHSLTFRPDGLEIQYRDLVVACPWALFNAEGLLVALDNDNPRAALIVPVDPAAIPFVELRQHGVVLTQGIGVRGPQCHFEGGHQLVLVPRYEIDSEELGKLLRQLGDRLGQQLPRGAPPPEAYPLAGSAEPATSAPDGLGWMTVAIQQVRFPHHCCECGRWTESSMPVPLSGGLLARLGLGLPEGEIAVPICGDCRELYRERVKQGLSGGLNRGIIIGTFAALLYSAWQGLRDPGVLAVAALGGAAVGGLLGMWLGTARAARLGIEFRRFRPDRGTVQLRCRDATFASQLVSANETRKR